jgi:hypothetical protein
MDPYSPDLSAASRKLYLGNLTRLAGGEFKNLNFLKKTESILERIGTLKPNTGRSYLIALVSATRDKPALKKAHDIYYAAMMESNKALRDQTQKTDSYKEKEMPQLDIEAKQKELESVLSVKKMTAADYAKLQQLVLLSLYTLLPPRRSLDYTEMKWGPAEETLFNYYDGKNFTFNRFKTQNTYSTQVVPVPPELGRILKFWHKHQKPSEFVLVNSRGGKMTSPSLNKALGAIFGVKMGPSMLRSIFLSNKFGDVIKELKKDTATMGTSVDTAQNVYIKN